MAWGWVDPHCKGWLVGERRSVAAPRWGASRRIAPCILHLDRLVTDHMTTTNVTEKAISFKLRSSLSQPWRHVAIYSYVRHSTSIGWVRSCLVCRYTVGIESLVYLGLLLACINQVKIVADASLQASDILILVYSDSVVCPARTGNRLGCWLTDYLNLIFCTCVSEGNWSYRKGQEWQDS